MPSVVSEIGWLGFAGAWLTLTAPTAIDGDDEIEAIHPAVVVGGERRVPRVVDVRRRLATRAFRGDLERVSKFLQGDADLVETLAFARTHLSQVAVR